MRLTWTTQRPTQVGFFWRETGHEYGTPFYAPVFINFRDQVQTIGQSGLIPLKSCPPTDRWSNQPIPEPEEAT